MRNKIICSDESKTELKIESHASRLEETWHHHFREAWWWQQHFLGMFFSGRGWETSQD